MFDNSALLAMYAQLPTSERDALDETILDPGINNFESLVQAIELVNTYFKESIDV